ncbi:hypothetical protein OPQ81_007702 [Rhizoctonia solani]|nr:hypothetical protein OPQ81_007702 [Rhizoctonia solani]
MSNSDATIPRPPSLKLYYMFANNPPPRDIPSRLVQIISGHGFFGEYNSRIRGQGHSKSSCGDPIQSRTT